MFYLLSSFAWTSYEEVKKRFNLSTEEMIESVRGKIELIPMAVKLELCKNLGRALFAKLGAEAAKSFVKSYLGEKIGGTAASIIVRMNLVVEGYLCESGMEAVDGILDNNIGNLIT